MSKQYDDYLQMHKENVRKAYEWIKENIPELIKNDGYSFNYQIKFNHDYTKQSNEEYDAYDRYFYGGNRSYKVVDEFKKAWLHHIHHNPHHWQHWILINDDPSEGEIILDMPDNYILEMICDWWSFSWASGDLSGIFKWYNDRKEYIKLSQKTRFKVERILDLIKEKIEPKEDKNNE